MTQKSLQRPHHTVPSETAVSGERPAGPRQERLSRLAASLDVAPPVQRLALGLPAPLKAGMQALSGMSLDDVQVHYNSGKPAHVQAHAFAQGTHIHLAPGQERHLPHEAWHVVQQAQGRVQATARLQPTVAINDDARLEHEADVMGARAARLPALRPAVSKAGQRMSRPVVQRVRGEDDKQKAAVPQRPWLRPAGLVLQGVGALLIAAVARSPRYAQLSWKTFHRQMPLDLLKLKAGLGASLVGNHLMGTEDMLGAATRGTRLDVRPKLTANQDKFNWLLGLGQVVVAGAVGHRALILGRGLGKTPLLNLGALAHALLMYQMLSSGTKLMGSEGMGAELIRTSRGQPRHADEFEHSQVKESVNDLISQILFSASLGRMYQIARMNKLPLRTLMRMRMNALAGAGMLLALNLSPAASLLPLMLGQNPGEVSFDPTHKPLDATRSALGMGSATLGMVVMNNSVRQFLQSMNFKDRKKLFGHLRMFGFGGTALYGGLTLAQILPVVYKMTHPAARKDPDE